MGSTCTTCCKSDNADVSTERLGLNNQSEAGHMQGYRGPQNRDGKGTSGGDAFGSGGMTIDDETYNNPSVLELRNQLGPFDFGNQEPDGIEREVRPITVLENGAKY